MSKKPLSKAADLTPDPKNANAGTERGRALLKESVESCGYGRGVFADKHGVVIGGNKTVEQAVAAGAEIIPVETRGDELVVVQRTDLDLLRDKKARQLAYYDNRTSEVGLQWSSSQVSEDALAGVNLSVGFYPDEIKDIIEPMEPRESGKPGTGTSPHLSDPSQSFSETMDAPISADAEAKQVSVRVVFANAEAHRRYLSLMFQLRARFPQLTTPAMRLLAYVQEAEGV